MTSQQLILTLTLVSRLKIQTGAVPGIQDRPQEDIAVTLYASSYT